MNALKITIGLSVIILCSFVACQTQSMDSKVVSAITNKCGVVFERGTTGIGEIVYTAKFPEKDYYTITANAKNTIDKTLNILPAVLKENQLSPVGTGAYNHYEWETPEIKVTMETETGENSAIRLWITNK